MNRLILDVDGCLLNYEMAFGSHFQVNPVDFWSNGHLHGDKMMDMVREFNATPAFARIPPVHGAQEAIKYFCTIGIPMTVITCCGDSEEIQDNRRDNLLALFGDVFDDIIIRPLGASKEDDFRALLDDRCLAIDDMIKHYQTGIEVGHDAILFETPYNGDLDAMRRPGTKITGDWNRVAAYVSKAYV